MAGSIQRIGAMVERRPDANKTKEHSEPASGPESLTERFAFTARHSDAINERIERVSDEVATRRTRWYGRIIQNYLNDDPDRLATFIAFNAMFAFMPVILTLAIGVALLLQLFTSADGFAEHEYTLNLPEVIADPVKQIMLQSSEGLLGVGVVTVVVLFWGGTRLYNSLDLAFAHIYRTKRRFWIKRKLFGMVIVPTLALTLVLTALVLPLILALVLIPLGALFDVVPGVGAYLPAILLLYVIGFAMLSVAYKAIPTHSPSFRSALPGAAVAALLFMLLALISPIYLRFFGGYNLYGAVFGLILTMMFWFYIAAQIIIIGAEINAYLEGRRDEDGHAEVAEEPAPQGRSRT